jgi:hypothetical protein
MSEKKSLDVDFERDMPLTPADLEALARSRDLRPLSTQAYLDWLTLMSATSKPVPRLNTDSDEPFEL